jgi:GT2 family glycosyltransferase
MSKRMTAVVVNYQTPDLLQLAVESFRSFYPDTPLLIVDNGSADGSREKIDALAALAPRITEKLLLEKNIYHGPAMDAALRMIETDYTFFFDSDTVMLKGGCLETMEGEFDDGENIYGVGQVDRVNKRGFRSESGEPILLSSYMVLRTKIYFTLPPFEHHGMPTLKNFTAARKRGYVLRNFPVASFIEHHGRGTASRFGYGLGLSGRINYLLNKIGV